MNNIMNEHQMKEDISHMILQLYIKARIMLDDSDMTQAELDSWITDESNKHYKYVMELDEKGFITLMFKELMNMMLEDAKRVKGEYHE